VRVDTRPAWPGLIERYRDRLPVGPDETTNQLAHDSASIRSSDGCRAGGDVGDPASGGHGRSLSALAGRVAWWSVAGAGAARTTRIQSQITSIRCIDEQDIVFPEKPERLLELDIHAIDEAVVCGCSGYRPR
jgi:hypothetical protein